MNQNQRQNIRINPQNSSRTYSFSQVVSRNNRNNTFVGSNLMSTFYRGARTQEIHNTRIENTTRENHQYTMPIFQTNLETSLYNALDDTFDDDDMTLPIIRYQSTSEESDNTNDASYSRNVISDIAQIVPGTNDTTFYMNFPNEDQTDDSTIFYSLFENSNYRIQYNHDQLMSYSEIESLYNHILNTLHTDDSIEEFVNSTLHETEYTQSINNNETEINKMKEKIHIGSYREAKNIGLLNDTCPIMYEEFHDKDDVCTFMNCNHGIHKSQLDSYLHRFGRCPLCNTYIH